MWLAILFNALGYACDLTSSRTWGVLMPNPVISALTYTVTAAPMLEVF